MVHVWLRSSLHNHENVHKTERRCSATRRHIGTTKMSLCVFVCCLPRAYVLCWCLFYQYSYNINLSKVVHGPKTWSITTQKHECQNLTVLLNLSKLHLHSIRHYSNFWHWDCIKRKHETILKVKPERLDLDLQYRSFKIVFFSLLWGQVLIFFFFGQLDFN